MKNKSSKIVVATNDELTNQVYVRRLWLAARNVPFSRRQWPDEIAKSFYDFKGQLLCADGRRWPIPDVDSVIGDPRWLSYWFEAANDSADELAPRRKAKFIERLRVLDLWFRIEKPELARHFGR